MTLREALVSHCGGHKLKPGQLIQLERHYELMVNWNRTLNLSRVPSVTEAAALHYCESLFLGDVLPRGELAIVDVGSGAGFPGIPLAVSRPDCNICLVEAHHRKAVFLREATRGLRNVSVLAERAEAVCRRFDWLVGRAVRLEDLLSLDLAANAAILTTSEDVTKVPYPIQIVPIPWSWDRVVAMFHVERANIH